MTTGSTGRRSGNNTLSTEDILKAATASFSRKGYRGTNLQDVAVALNVTRQAIYYYYPSKHAILLTLFERFFDELDEAVAKAASGIERPSERFEAMLRAHVIVVARSPELSSIFTREYVSLEPAAQKAIQTRRRTHHQALVAAYEEARDAGEVRDLPPSPTVSLLFGAANWIFRWYHRRETGMSVDEIADLALSLFRSGYLGDGSGEG